MAISCSPFRKKALSQIFDKVVNRSLLTEWSLFKLQNTFENIQIFFFCDSNILVIILSKICVFIRSFIKRQTSGTSSDNEWYIEWQRVVQRVTTSGTTSDNEWQRVVQQVTTNDNVWYNEWQRMKTSDNEWLFRLNFLFFQIRVEPTTKHPQENSLNIE